MKKAQITLFIVIGVVVLIVGGLIMYLSQEGEDISTEAETRAISIPKELNPIKEYVDECIEDISYEAITKVGFCIF